MNDLEIVPFATVQQYGDALGILVGPTSPLRGVLKTAVDNTSLVAASTDAPAGVVPSIGSRLAEGAKDLFSSAQKKVPGLSGAAAGTAITQHFGPIHRLMAGRRRSTASSRNSDRSPADARPQVGGASPLKHSRIRAAVWRMLSGRGESAAAGEHPRHSGAQNQSSVSTGSDRRTERLYQAT